MSSALNFFSEIQRGSQTDQINGTLLRNRQKVHSIYDDIDHDVELLEKLTKDRLNEIYSPSGYRYK